MLKNDRLYKTALYVVLTVVGLLVLLPLYWMVVSSLKSQLEILSIPPRFVPTRMLWENYGMFLENFPFFRLISNSLIVAGLTTAISVVVASMTGYGLVKFRSRLTKLFFILLLSSAMVPPVVKVLPLYVQMVKIGLNDTLAGVIIPFYVSVFGIFFIRQYCQSIPDDLIEAARVEGVPEFQLFFRIIFPIIKPALASLAVLKFLMTWNDFFWPLIMLSTPKKMTLQVGIAIILDPEYPINYGMLMAGATLAIVPIVLLFIVFQRQIVKSVATTGMKA